MTTSFQMVGFSVLELGGVVIAAGYLIATRRRSRRAATLGLAAVGLLALAMVGWPRGPWAAPVELASAYGLFVWAILADRPPPAAD